MKETGLELLSGTEMALVAQVPGAGNRWHQVHFNMDVARLFFNLEPGSEGKSITLEKISALGNVVARASRQLVFPDSNRNSRIEFDFGGVQTYPAAAMGRPIVVVVEADYLTYRYHTVMPGTPGHEEMTALLHAGRSIGKGVRRRIVTLDDVEAYWPESALRGAVQ